MDFYDTQDAAFLLRNLCGELSGKLSTVSRTMDTLAKDLKKAT